MRVTLVEEQRAGRVAADMDPDTAARVDVADLLMRNYAVVGVYAGGTTPEQDAVAYRRFIELVEQGAIRTPVGTVSGFDEVPDVLSLLTSGGPAGKHIIHVS
jgi:NADPH2:quinone reductase